ncbi:peptidylprolyl isomerase [Candidatus Daviesbacteria bacterium]|nr:peptidylprolyl isomerase [Candidatus Daviesbacteria bacterium]
MKQYSKFPGVLPDTELTNKQVVIETNKGKIAFEIYPEASKAASNFIFLAKDKFYDGLKFHRVVPGFVIQGGDPKGDGTGGPGYKFEDEPVTKKYLKGIVAMANAGPNTNGSQFFIMLEDNLTLPPNYTIFGKVTAGQEVVDQIKVGDEMKTVAIENLK